MTTPTWREALEFAAETKSTDWPERCQQMVDLARKALMSDLKQKPFAWMLNSEVAARDNKYSGTVWYDDPKRQSANWTPLYVTGAPQQAEPVPEGYRIVPDWKGYALLGSGRYLINHAANYDPELGAELIITLATEKDREGGRKIGESRPNAEDSPPVQPDEMVIRIGFLNGDALFVLEDQLADVRKVLEAAGKAAPQQAEAVPNRAFLERTLAAMEGVIDVADRKTDEFEAMRSCIVDLTLMLYANKATKKGSAT